MQIVRNVIGAELAQSSEISIYLIFSKGKWAEIKDGGVGATTTSVFQQYILQLKKNDLQVHLRVPTLK
jgi:hypothetical protein